MKTRLARIVVGGISLLSLSMAASGASAPPSAAADRSVLPIPAAPYSGELNSTVPESSPPSYPSGPTAPRGAPNILVVMTDDVGFGASSTFGGPVPTPVLDGLAKAGLRYNNFHTTALCSPTRAALLTGRNAHSVGFGTVQEMATGYPGYNSLIPKSAATFGRVFRDNGYSTAWFGKNHNLPDWQNSRAGPFDRWPNGLGFEYFYGFNGGETDQWAPAIIENTTPREPPHDDPGYILDRDLADRAVGWMRNHAGALPDKPFLIYYAPGSAHTPHHAPADWLARFRGKFDQGWDKMREESFARQKAQGVIPRNSRLTPRPAEIPAWDSLSPKARAVASRLMEAYAAQLAFSDHQIGRVIDELKHLGQYDNTLILFIQGDNGGSAEGGVNGAFNMVMGYNGLAESIDDMYRNIDLIGSPKANNNYPVGWAWAMNTPFQWTKQIAGFYGGVRNGMVLSWPRRIKTPGEVRGQFGHVIDVAPTLYEAAGIPAPNQVDGVAQMPLDGASFLGTLSASHVPAKRTRQYFEIMGNRALYEDGWIAVTHPLRLPWVPTAANPDKQPVWELYNVAADFSQSRNLAARNPRKLEELKVIFDAEARRNHVYPISTSLMERSQAAARPYASHGRDSLVFHGSQSRLPSSVLPRLVNTSWTVDADVELSSAGAEGMVITQGGRFAGWGLMLVAGRPTFIYKSSHRPEDMVRLQGEPLGPGRHRLSIAFRYDGGGFGKGGAFSLLADDREVARVRADRTIRFVASGESDIGLDTGTPLTDDYELPYRLQGEVREVRVGILK